MIKVVFVCLGNICRSPMAEAIFQQQVNEAGLSEKVWVDSAGTGNWHIGKPCHSGTQAILDDKNIPYNGRARQIGREDTIEPDTYLVVMDDSNRDNIVQLYGTPSKLHRLLDFAHNYDETEVPDPYYTGGFNYVFDLVSDGCTGFLAQLREWENL